MPVGQVAVIGVSGGSASGKTTVAERIRDACRGSVVILSHDFYYKPYAGLPLAERVRLNFDHPDAFDTPRMIGDIRKLRQGIAIERPVYSFTEHTRLPETVRVEPAGIIIIEGFLIFSDPELRDLMDIKVFVDTDADERLIRRIRRDVNERGRSLDSVIEQYVTTVKPMHEQFVEPGKKYADIIIPRGGLNDIAIDMLVHRIRAILRDS